VAEKFVLISECMGETGLWKMKFLVKNLDKVPFEPLDKNYGL
jgi:hypothetical protein